MVEKNNKSISVVKSGDSSNFLHDFSNFVDKYLREIRYASYGLAAIGIVLIFRSTRALKKFERISEIPEGYISGQAQLQGHVRQISGNGRLMVEHIPVISLTKPARQGSGGFLPIRLGGVSVQSEGISWMQHHLLGKRVWFRMLTVHTESSIDGTPTLQQTHTDTHSMQALKQMHGQGQTNKHEPTSVANTDMQQESKENGQSLSDISSKTTSPADDISKIHVEPKTQIVPVPHCEESNVTEMLPASLTKLDTKSFIDFDSSDYLLCIVKMRKKVFGWTSVNEELVRRGLATVQHIDGLPHNSTYIKLSTRLLRAEVYAEKKGRGVWARPPWTQRLKDKLLSYVRNPFKKAKQDNEPQS